ncbi:MAG: TRAP transporter substrate-binding protein [Rhodospirillales bacterium]|nr:TRAP transporter substrate-binding protein [Rhodospirillales bacterium]
MGKTIFRAFLISAVALSAYTSTEALAEKVTIRIASFLPERSSTVRGMFKPWIAGVKKELGDAIEIKEFWGGALGRAPKKQFDHAVDGVADMTAVVPGYTPGRFGGYSVHDLPFMIKSGVEGSIAQWRMFKAGHFTGFEKVKMMGIFITAPYKIHTKKPFKTVAGLKGMKIRTAGTVQAATIKSMGAVPIGIPLSQATEALSRGVLDGVLLGYAAVGVFKMSTIATYHYIPALSAGTVVAVMNKQKWESLPAKVKAVMDKYGGETMAATAGAQIDKVEKTFYGKMKASKKHHFIPASPELSKKGQAAFQPLYDKWIKENKNGQKIFDDYVRIIKEIRAGK